MAKSNKRLNRDGWNPSHRTRFSRDNQPDRKRGPGKIKIDRNLLRMLADELGQEAGVTNSAGERVPMTQANYMVRAMIKKAMKGGLDDLLKLFDRFARWGLLEQLDVEEGLLDELNEQLRDERESNRLLRERLDLANLMANIHMSETLALLGDANALLAQGEDLDPIDVITLRRRIVKAQLEMRDALQADKTPRPLRWEMGQTVEEWAEEGARKDDEERRIRRERLAEFDRQNPIEDEARRPDPDDDDDFFEDLTRED